MKEEINFTILKNKIPARSIQKQNLYKLLIARSDIKASFDACNLLLEKVKGIKDDLYYPLSTAVIICYARPFTANKPYGALPNKWSEFTIPRYKQIHKKLINARNKLMAHSDMEVRKVKILPPKIPLSLKNSDEIKSPKVSTVISYYIFPVDFFNGVKEVNLNIGRRLHEEAEKLVSILYKNMDLPNAMFDLRLDDGL